MKNELNQASTLWTACDDFLSYSRTIYCTWLNQPVGGRVLARLVIQTLYILKHTEMVATNIKRGQRCLIDKMVLENVKWRPNLK